MPKAGDFRKLLLWGILVLLSAYALYFAGLGSYPLTDPNEPVYGQVAKEMAASGEWLTPHYNHRPWFDKPPLFYWLSAASLSLLGPTELAARLPSALLGLALLLLVYLLASFDFGRRIGLLAVVVMGTCLEQIILARAAVTDMTLAFCLTFALYAYRRWLDQEGPSRLLWAVLCGAMAGLGMLAKGPVAPVLLGTTFLLHLGWSGRLRRLPLLDPLAACGAALAVGLPWYLAMFRIHGDKFVQDFLVANNVARFLQAEHQSQTGDWTSYFRNLPVLLAFFFPWSVFLPQALARAWRRNTGAKLASLWLAVVFIFFSLSKTQLVTYIFPLYPAAALFVALLWDEATRQEGPARRGVRLGLWIVLGIVLLLPIPLIRESRAQFPEAERAGWILAGILLALPAAALAGMRKGRPRAALGSLALGMVVLVLFMVYGALPLVHRRISTRDLVARIPSAEGMGLFQFNLAHSRYVLDPQSLLFYLPRVPEAVPDMDTARRLLALNSPVLILCRSADARQLAVPGGGLFESGKLAGVSNPALWAKGKE